MELNHLRSFVAVARQGHLTRAAESLHLSQPAVSGQIKSLEETLGVTLFERSSSGMALTPSGRRLLSEAEQIIESVQQMKNAAQGLRGQPTGKLKLGTILDPAFLRVGALLVKTLERYPQIELELHQVLSSDALLDIRSGELDASFYFGRAPEPDLKSVALREMVYRVAVPIAWADEIAGESWEALAARPWVITPDQSSHRALLLELFRERALSPARLIEADNESVITNLIESGVGASLIREEIALASSRSGTIAIWPGARVTTGLWLLHAADRGDDPLVAALLAVLRDVWAETPQPPVPATPAA